MTCTLGAQAKFGEPVAASISFDPPSLRPPSAERARELLLKPLSRSKQENLCLLTALYESWIDSSLKVHLKNVKSTVRRPRRLGESDADAHLKALGEKRKLSSLSNQEAAVLSQLGENLYLRCFFCRCLSQET